MFILYNDLCSNFEADHIITSEKLYVSNCSIDYNRIFHLAYYYNNYKFFKYLLKIKQVNLEALKNDPIEYSCMKGYYKIVKYLLTKFTLKIDPSSNYNFPIRIACAYGHHKIVKLLLKDNRVDPSSHNNNSIRMASKNGHLKIIKYLLKDKRVNPSDNNNEALELAIKSGHPKIFKLLLKHVKSKLNLELN
jgi:ankyrin repeat protein